jgi:CrcB protein
MTTFALLILGSAAGGVSRFAAQTGIARLSGDAFPYGTLAVNMLGCLILGALDVWAREKLALPKGAQLALMVGFCGSFTTFSTFALESLRLIDAGKALHAGANIALSVGLGLALIKLGASAARAL